MEVALLRESKNKNALQYFEAVLKTNNRNIEAILGKVFLVIHFFKNLKYLSAGKIL